METIARNFTVDRNSVDAEAGTFEAVVFTNGEATDGHRLDMAGADIPDEMPLFINHERDPRTQLGTLRLMDVTDSEVVMRGEIMTEGNGLRAEERQDILDKMAAGHVKRMSGWFAVGKSVSRTDLPKDHWAYVSREEARSDPRLRYGRLAQEWEAREGSVVGLGADPGAVARDAGDDDRSMLSLFQDTVRQLVDLGYDGETLYCVLEEVRKEYREDDEPEETPAEREIEDEEPLPSPTDGIAGLAEYVEAGCRKNAADVKRTVAAWKRWRRGGEIADAGLLTSVKAFNAMYQERYAHG